MDISYIEADESEWHEHDPDHDRIEHDDNPDIRETKLEDMNLIEKLNKKNNETRECE
jgi:hypothetical protein